MASLVDSGKSDVKENDTTTVCVCVGPLADLGNTIVVVHLAKRWCLRLVKGSRGEAVARLCTATMLGGEAMDNDDCARGRSMFT